jgi:hypothetical protein
MILPNRQKPPYKDLLAHWFDKYHFDVTDGMILSPIGDSSRLPQAGRGYKFDGVDDYINFGTNALFNPLVGSGYTFFINTKITTTGNDVLAMSNIASSTDYSWYILASASKIFIIFRTNDSNYSFWEALGTYNANQFYRICFLYSGGNTLQSCKLILDGIQIALTFTKVGSFTSLSNNPLNIGRRNTTRAYTDQLTSDIQLFNELISDNEAIDITNGKEINKNPVFHAKCEDTGLIAFDSSGNNNHGTKTNTDITTTNTFSYTGSDVPKSYQNELGYQYFLKKCNTFIDNGLSANHINGFQVGTSTILTTISNTELKFANVVGSTSRIGLGGIYADNLKGAAGQTLKIRFSFKSDVTTGTATTLNGRFYGVGNGTKVYLKLNGEEVVVSGVDYYSIGNATLYAPMDFNRFSVTAGVWYTIEVTALMNGSSAFDNAVPYWYFDLASGFAANEGLNIKDLEFEYTDALLPLLSNGTGLIQDTVPIIDYKGQVSYAAKLVESNCISFDGVDDYMQQPTNTNDPIFNTGSNEAFNWKMWIKLTETGSRQAIYNGGAFNVTGSQGIRLETDNFSKLRFSIWDEASGAADYLEVLTDTALVLNEWYLLEIDWDGSTSVSGITVKANGTLLTTTDTSNGVFVLVGQHTTSPSFGIRATLDGGYDMAYFSLAKQGELPFTELVASMGAGNTVFDASGNGNNGTLVNGVSWGVQDVYHYNYENGFKVNRVFGNATQLRVSTEVGSPLLGFNPTSRNELQFEFEVLPSDIFPSNWGVKVSSASTKNIQFTTTALTVQTSSANNEVTWITPLVTNTRYIITIIDDFGVWEIYLNGVLQSTFTNNGNNAAYGIERREAPSFFAKGLIVYRFQTISSNQVEDNQTYLPNKYWQYVSEKGINLANVGDDNAMGALVLLSHTYTFEFPAYIDTYKPSQRNHNGAETKVDFNPYLAPALSDTGVREVKETISPKLYQSLSKGGEAVFYNQLLPTPQNRVLNYLKQEFVLTETPAIWYDFNDVDTLTLVGNEITQVASKGSILNMELIYQITSNNNLLYENQRYFLEATVAGGVRLYAENGNKSDYAFLHDNLKPCTIFIVATAEDNADVSQFLTTSHSITTLDVGMAIFNESRTTQTLKPRTIIVRGTSGTNSHAYTGPDNGLKTSLNLISWNQLSTNLDLKFNDTKLNFTIGSTSSADSTEVLSIYNYRGKYAEMIIYDRALSTTEHKEIEDYLKAKWFLN